MNRELLTEDIRKRLQKVKGDWATQEEYRSMAQVWKNAIREVKLARLKSSEGCEGQIRTSAGTLIARGRLGKNWSMRHKIYQQKIWQKPIFIGKTWSLASQCHKTARRICKSEALTTWMCTEPWDQMGCNQRCCRSWPVSLHHFWNIMVTRGSYWSLK